jgi:hypothetical protein
MSLENLLDFVNDFEAKYGAKPTRIGITKDRFEYLEKQLEDQAPVKYTACYLGTAKIRLFGTEVFCVK